MSKDFAMIEDFPSYAARRLLIRTKVGEIAPLRLIAAQVRLHEAVETQRRETGKVRLIVLKARQAGVSTYVQARHVWKAGSGGGSALAVASCHAAAEHLRDVADRFGVPCRGVYSVVRLAGLVGAARPVRFLHGSEVDFWPKGEGIGRALSLVPDEAGTEVVLESILSGRPGAFHDLCVEAQAGRGDYRLCFIPWFATPTYSRPVDAGFVMDDEEAAYAARHRLSAGQVAWRRVKAEQIGGRGAFGLEYPASAADLLAAPPPKGWNEAA